MVEAEEEYTEQLEILISCFLRPFKVEDSHILNDSGVARSFSFSFVFGSVSLKSRSSDGGQLKESSVLSRRFELHLPQCRNCPFPSPGGNEKCWCSLKRWLHCLFVPQSRNHTPASTQVKCHLPPMSPMGVFWDLWPPWLITLLTIENNSNKNYWQKALAILVTKWFFSPLELIFPRSSWKAWLLGWTPGPPWC